MGLRWGPRLCGVRMQGIHKAGQRRDDLDVSTDFVWVSSYQPKLTCPPHIWYFSYYYPEAQEPMDPQMQRSWSPGGHLDGGSLMSHLTKWHVNVMWKVWPGVAVRPDALAVLGPRPKPHHPVGLWESAVCRIAATRTSKTFLAPKTFFSSGYLVCLICINLPFY